MNLAENQTRRQGGMNCDEVAPDLTNRFALTVVTARAAAGRARGYPLRPLTGIVVSPGTTLVTSTILSHQKPRTFTSNQRLSDHTDRRILFLLI